MTSDQILPGLAASLVVGLAIVGGLLIWRQRLPADIAGRVKADLARAMVRALLLLLAGLALALGLAAGWLPNAEPMRWLALVLLALGGIGFLARLALYWLRVRPELEQLSTPGYRLSAIGYRSRRQDDETTPEARSQKPIADSR